MGSVQTDDRAAARIFLNIQRCADHVGAIVHSAYPHAFFVLKPIRKSHSIVLDAEDNFIPAVRQTNDDLSGLTVFDGIRHSLLSDSIEVGCQIDVANQNIFIALKRQEISKSSSTSDAKCWSADINPFDPDCTGSSPRASSRV